MLDLLGIGAQKAGTSWLFRWLGAHPRISFPAGKEVHFWDKKRDRGIDWYRGLFSADDGKLHGEITPAYSCLSSESIAECHGTFPGLRLVYLLRNPIDRAWSAAKMELQRKHPEMIVFPDGWFIEEFRSGDSLARGDYETCLKNWLRFYRQDQLLVLRFEELVENPASLLAKCCLHLGVEPLDSPYESLLRAKEFVGLPEPLRPSLLAVLHEIYDEKIRSLQGFLGWDFGEWLDSHNAETFDSTAASLMGVPNL
jgi:hypothetical protein